MADTFTAREIKMLADPDTKISDLIKPPKRSVYKINPDHPLAQGLVAYGLSAGYEISSEQNGD